MALIDPRQILIPGYDRPAAYHQPRWPIEADLSNGLLAGIAKLVAFSELGNFPLDLIGGARASTIVNGANGSGPAPVWAATPYGPGLRCSSNVDFDIGTGYIFPTADVNLGTADATLFATAIPNRVVAQSGVIFGARDVTTTIGWELDINTFNTNDGILAINFLDGDGSGSVNTGIVIPAGALFTAVGVIDAGTVRAYINGADCGVTGSVTSAINPNVEMGIGCGIFQGSSNFRQFFFDGIILQCGLIKGRAWSAIEAAQYNRNPFALYKPIVRKTWFFPAPQVSAGSVLNAPGTGTAALVGAASAQAIEAAAGVGAAGLIGKALASAAVTAAGIGAAAEVGAAAAAAAVSAPGVGAATLTAQAQAAAAVNAPGTGSAALVGAAQAQAVISAAGTGAATESAAATAAAAINAPGVGAAAWISNIPGSTLAAAGIGVAMIVGAALASAVVSALGAGAASWVSQAAATAGVLAAAGIGAGNLAGAALASAAITAAGFGAAFWAAPSGDKPGHVTASDKTSTISPLDKSATLAASNKRAGSITGTTS